MYCITCTSQQFQTRNSFDVIPPDNSERTDDRRAEQSYASKAAPSPPCSLCSLRCSSVNEILGDCLRRRRTSVRRKMTSPRLTRSFSRLRRGGGIAQLEQRDLTAEELCAQFPPLVCLSTHFLMLFLVLRQCLCFCNELSVNDQTSSTTFNISIIHYHHDRLLYCCKGLITQI